MTIVDDISIPARAERLKAARRRHYSSAEKAAIALGMKGVTVRAHENAQNGFPVEVAEAYASAYGVSLDWLLTGRDDGDRPVQAPQGATRSLQMQAIGNGKARLEMNLVLPFSVALQILAIVEEAQK